MTCESYVSSGSMVWYHALLGLICALAMLSIACAAGKPKSINLVPNASFEKVERAKVGKRRMVPSGWRFYVIVMPASDSVDNAIKRTGKYSFKFTVGEKGKAFLHSPAFDVEPGQAYRISAWVRGKGALAIEMLWWQSYLKPLIMSKHHRDAMKKPVKASEKQWKRVEVTFTAPNDAKRAYVRLVATNGDVWVDDVEVAPVSK